MAYQPFQLPPNTPEQVSRFIGERLEPHLIDVHTMLRLPIGTDDGLRGGCNFSAAQILFAVIGGVSATLYEPKDPGDRDESGKLFKQVLDMHFPWDSEPNGAITGMAAASILYDLYRNPLVHGLGLKPDHRGLKLKVAKGPLSETEIEELEQSLVRPPSWGPTLREEGAKKVLLVKGLYWGVRQMVCKLVAEKMVEASNIAGRFEAGPVAGIAGPGTYIVFSEVTATATTVTTVTSGSPTDASGSDD